MASINKIASKLNKKKPVGILLGSTVTNAQPRVDTSSLAGIAAASASPQAPRPVTDTSTAAGVARASGGSQTAVKAPAAPLPKLEMSPAYPVQRAVAPSSFNETVAAGQSRYDDRSATMRAAAAQAQANAREAAARVAQQNQSDYTDPYDRAAEDFAREYDARDVESKQLFADEQAKYDQLLAAIHSRTQQSRAASAARLNQQLAAAGGSITAAQAQALGNLNAIPGQTATSAAGGVTSPYSSLTPEMLAQAAAMAQANASTNAASRQQADDFNYLQEDNQYDDSFADKYGRSYQAQQGSRNDLLFGGAEAVNNNLNGRTSALSEFAKTNQSGAKTYGDILAQGDELNMDALDKATADDPYLLEAMKQYSEMDQNTQDNETVQRGQDLNSQTEITTTGMDNATDLAKNEADNRAEIQMKASEIYANSLVEQGKITADQAMNTEDNMTRLQEAAMNNDQKAAEALVRAQATVDAAGVKANAPGSTKNPNPQYLKGDQYLAARKATANARTYIKAVETQAMTDIREAAAANGVTLTDAEMKALLPTAVDRAMKNSFTINGTTYRPWGGFSSKLVGELTQGYFTGGYTTPPQAASPKASAPSGAQAGTFAQQAAAIAAIESGGWKNPYVASTDKSSASGKYAVTDDTWNGYGGYARAKDAPPATQEKFFAEKWTGYVNKFGVEGAVVAWFQGPGVASGKSKPIVDANGTTVNAYVQKFRKQLAALGPSLTQQPEPTKKTTDQGSRAANAQMAFSQFKKSGMNVDGMNASSAAHKLQNPNSDHDTGLAFDWHTKGEAAVQQALSTPGVRYVIHNKTIYQRKNGFKPEPYTGKFKNGKMKDPHANHIHVNF